MTKRTALYMLAGAMLVPIGAIITLFVIPNGLSPADTFAAVFNQVWGRPLPMGAFVFWMVVFALLGGLVAKVRKRRDVLAAQSH